MIPPTLSEAPRIVLVTGGTGTIGGEIVRALCAFASTQNASCDNTFPARATNATRVHKPWRIVACYAHDEERARRVQNETGCELVRADIADEAQVESLFAMLSNWPGHAPMTFTNDRVAVAPDADEVATSLGKIVASRVIASAKIADVATVSADIATASKVVANAITTKESDANVADASEASASGTQEGARQEAWPLFAVIHAAGISRDALLVRQTSESWRETLRVNADGSFLVARAALRFLQPGGRLILLTSRVGENGATGQGAYAASKAALLALMHSAAREGAARGIAVNAICPGFVPSAMSQALSQSRLSQARDGSVFGCFGTPREVASAVQWLLGPDAASISGQVIHCDSR